MITRWIRIDSNKNALQVNANDFSAVELQIISDVLRGMSVDTSFKVSSLLNDLDDQNLFKGAKNVNKSNE